MDKKYKLYNKKEHKFEYGGKIIDEDLANYYNEILAKVEEPFIWKKLEEEYGDKLR